MAAQELAAAVSRSHIFRCRLSAGANKRLGFGGMEAPCCSRASCSSWQPLQRPAAAQRRGSCPRRSRAAVATRAEHTSAEAAGGSASTSGSAPASSEPAEAFAPGGSPASLLLRASELAAAQSAADQGLAAAPPAPQRPRRPPVDHFRAAGQRLRNLLNGVGDGEEEMLNNMLEEQPAEEKMAMCLFAGGLISTAAAAVCWLCGLDPLGGASLSFDSLRAAAVGGAAATPLVAAKALLWSEGARRQLPFLEDIHRAQVGWARRWCVVWGCA